MGISGVSTIELPVRYSFEGVLKESDAIAVYRVSDAVDGVRKAIKILRAKNHSSDQRLRFSSEARTLASLNHPGIVRVFEYGVLDDALPYFTMELIDGRRLTDFFDGSNWTALYDVAIQVAAGLHHIHHFGIIHLDLKPSNVMVTADGRAKIMDFGVASESTELFDRKIRGTLHYMAPEVLKQERVDHRADLYGFGMTLYETVTGTLPNYARPPLEIIRAHLDGEIRRPSSINPHIPPGFEKVILRLLERDPRQRYPSAAAVLHDLARASGVREPAAELLAGRGELLASPLIGRDAEIATILDSVKLAGEGEGGAVLLTGPEGMGKSRIVQDAMLRSQIEGARVFRGRCPVNKKSIYAPFFDIFRQMLRAVNPDAEAGPELRRLLRSVAPKAEPGGGRAQKFRLFNAITQSIQDFFGFLHVERESASTLVLVVEDLEWADPATAELFCFLVGEARRSNMLMVGTLTTGVQTELSDPDKTNPDDDWTLRCRDLGIRVVDVAPMDEETVGEFLGSLLGEANPPKDLVRWILWESDGSPLYVRRATEYLIAHEYLEWTPEGWRADMSRIQSLRIPGGATALWGERIEMLSEDQRALLEAASVLGNRVGVPILAAVSGVGEERVFTVLRQLATMSLLDEEDDGEVFEFPQVSLRETAYAAMAERARSTIHERAAKALEETLPEEGSEVLGQIAYHYARSDDHLKAIDYSVAAGDLAYGAMSYAHAADSYRSALELMDLVGREAGRFETREKLGDSYERAGNHRGAMQAYQFLLKSVQARDDSQENRLAAAGLMRKICRVLVKRSEYDAALSYVQSAIDIYRESKVPSSLVEMLNRAAMIHREKGDLAEAGRLVDEASETASDLEPQELHAHVESTRGLVALARGEWRPARDHFERALGLAEAHGNEVLVRKITSNLGLTMWKLGEWDSALECYRTNSDLAQGEGDIWNLVRASNQIAQIELARGEFLAASERFDKNLRFIEKLGSAENEALAQKGLGEALEMMGRWSEALERYHRCLQIAGFDETHPARVSVYVPLARVTSKLGDIPRALQYAQTAWETAERSRDEDLMAEAAFVLAQVERERENFDESASLLERALSLFDRNSTIHGCARTHARVADLMLRREDFDGAETNIRQAQALARKLGDRFTLAQTFWLEGKLHFFRGSTEAGEASFAESREILDELDAKFDLGRLHFDLGLLREDPRLATSAIRRSISIFERLRASLDLERARGALFRINPSGKTSDKGTVVGLYEIVKIINSTLDLQDLLQRMLDIVLQRLRAERGMIALLDPITGTVRFRVAKNIGEGDSPKGRSPQWIVREVIRSGQSIMSADARSDQRLVESDTVVAENIVSLLCVPLVIKDRISGAIYVDHRETKNLFSQRDMDFLEAFADQAAIAVENARLYQDLEEARNRLSAENETLRNEVLAEKHLDSIVGHSEAVARIQFMVKKAAASASTVLIRGESGTGKGLVARIIHNIGPRRHGPFIKFNCAALPETLAESELFGHERGAFTGADRRKPGRFELADGGTIFLDEVGKINLAMQAKLLRVVEDKEFERVGGTQTIRSDVKIITATNLDLESAIASGQFREDLFYRLNIIPIVLPPLRNRKDDIPDLVEHFVRRICRDLGIEPMRLEPGVIDLFLEYDWPGNIRELEASIHRAIVLASSDTLTQNDFYTLLSDPHNTILAHAPREMIPAEVLHPLVRRLQIDSTLYDDILARVDRQLIEQTLRETGGKIRETARRLGLARNTLRSKLEKYGLRVE